MTNDNDCIHELAPFDCFECLLSNINKIINDNPEHYERLEKL